MMRSTTISLTLLLAACNAGSDSSAVEAVSRDSAGVAIREYPAGAWDRVPQWHLADAPIAVIGGDIEEVDVVGLETLTQAAFLQDNRIVATVLKPPQVYLFAADGQSHLKVGSQGEGPGQYQFPTNVLVLPGDTIAVTLATRRQELLYRPDGSPVRTVQLPIGGSPMPLIPLGRAGDSIWIMQQVTAPTAQASSGTDETFRIDFPILSWNVGADGMDTLFTLPGPESRNSSMSMAGTTIQIARPIAYAANSFAVLSNGTIWSTNGDGFILDARDAQGTLTSSARFDRPIRPVADADRDRYKERLRDGLERVKGMAMVPPGLIESELKRIDQTEFATDFPAIGQLLVGRDGQLWAAEMIPGIDSSFVYLVLDSEGKPVGRISTGAGQVLAASSDRVLVRKEDESTGLVRLEVWEIIE